MRTEDNIQIALEEGDYKKAFIFMMILLNERTIDNNKRLIELNKIMMDMENRIFSLEKEVHHD